MIKLLTNKNNQAFAVIAEDTHIGRWCEEQGRLDVDRTVDDVCQMLMPGDTVLDIGANIGIHSIPYAERVGITGTVLSFEACVDNYACLLVNSRNYRNIIPIQQAVGDETGVIQMSFDQNNPGASHISTGMIGDFAAKITKIDNWSFKKCDFIKIDVEGYEPYVIRGAAETIKHHKPKLIIELNDGTLSRFGFTKATVIDLMAELNYKPLFLGQQNYTMPQIDVIFIPS